MPWKEPNNRFGAPVTNIEYNFFYCPFFLSSGGSKDNEWCAGRDHFPEAFFCFYPMIDVAHIVEFDIRHHVDIFSAEDPGKAFGVIF